MNPDLVAWEGGKINCFFFFFGSVTGIEKIFTSHASSDKWVVDSWVEKLLGGNFNFEFSQSVLGPVF